MANWIVGALVLAGGLYITPANAADVDAAIVFAIDASASVDPDTAQLQREGHAQALEAPEVIAAIQRGLKGCIAITYFEWESYGRKRSVLPWSRICDANDGAHAAAVIRQKGTLRGFGRRTSLSFAINHSDDLLERFAHRTPRKIIDISAQGENNDGTDILRARAQALLKGHVINAIVGFDREDSRELLPYFKERIIGGPGAFVMSIDAPGDYAEGLRRKLVQEIAGHGPPSLSQE